MVFEKLEKRIILSGILEAVTPIHIGSSKTEFDIEEVDMPVLVAPSGEPYIPGSSLKGKTRTEVERIARTKGQYVCTPPNVRDMCGSIKSINNLCIACRLFGTAGSISVGSKVKFRDAYPIEKVESLIERTGIAIDRSTGTVSKSALYTIQAVPAGTKFSLEIVAENLDEEELRMLTAALASVEDSAIGGASSRGFGKIKMKFTRLQERTAGFYLGDEKESVIEGDELNKWMRR
ncbi:MAG: type III CRISPR-associated RAMP protein Csx7 [Candidatus Bathyarchaeia archaeon]